MNKALFDIIVIGLALIAGGVVSILDNPLTAIFLFLLMLGSWELAKFLPSFFQKPEENA